MLIFFRSEARSVRAAFLEILARCFEGIIIVYETMYVNDAEKIEATTAALNFQADIIAAFAIIFFIKFRGDKCNKER